MKILIKNGRVLDPAQNIDDVMDVFVQNGMISEIGQDLDLDDLEELEIIDATDKIVCPGFIDMHVHLREQVRVRRQKAALQRLLVCPTPIR